MADTNIDFSTKYSLSSLINNLLRINQNGLEIMNKLSDITTTDADVVEIDVLDENNQISKVFVPSYGQLKADINRLDNNIKQLSGIGDSNANVQLQDGSFRKLILSNLQLEGSTIQTIESPSEFESKNNWFFESFLNPLLYVSFNFTGQIPADTERCKVQRFILNLDNANKRNIWNNQLNKASNLDYVGFFQLLLNNGITYFLDEDVIDMPPRDIRFFGNFTVQRVFDEIIESEVDGVTTQKRRFRFQLDSLNYNDAVSEFQRTQQLKIGDSLVIVGEGTNNNTKYEIINIDEATGNIIEVKLIEGYDTIAIGSTLSYYSPDSAPVNLDINIGFNEYTVVFVKPINPISKIPALEWSPGVAFYTNDLSILDENDQQLSLEEYYQEQVVDFGSMLYNMAKDGIPPSTVGETPYIPEAIADDFQVLQINNHITDVARIDKIKKLQTEKLSIQSELDQLNKSIEQKRADINTKRYTSQSARDTDQSELSELINKSASASTLLKSAVDEIIALAESDNLEGITPKYRIKGFWPVPEAVPSARTGPQEVVQFKVRYRYVTKDGGSNQPDQIEFTDNNGTKRRGTFSTWEEFLTPVRKRLKDPSNGNYYWSPSDVENADEVNTNQLEIPIRQGEGVEFQIKSLSEAGWPTNPVESDYCPIIRVDFPDELVGTNEIATIVEQARLASESLEVTAALTDSGVIQHISEQFTQNESFYAHPATMIASGFLTDEQNVINLFEKLSDFETRIRLIEESITGEKGVLQTIILDPNGNEKVIKPDTVVRYFAGNYKDEVKDLDIKKGVIVSKTYSLRLTNVNATNLELYSRNYGNFTQKINSSVSGGTGYNANDNDYNITRRYDFVPLGPSNLDTQYVTNYEQFVNLPYQTGQVRGQFINTRYLNIESTAPLYEDIDINGDIVATLPLDVSNGFPAPGTTIGDYTEHEYILHTGYPLPSSNLAGEFIWSGQGGATSDTALTSDYTSAPTAGIFVHNLHPLISTWGAVTTVPGTAGLGAAGPTGVRNSGFAPLVATDVTSGSLKQAAYKYYNTGATYDSANSSKMAFEEYDQYLIGSNSCGAYLFLSPTNNTGAINVDGSNQLSIKTLPFGSENSINIPIVFQYRMTDFFGEGTDGLGSIGGDFTNQTSQLEYTKRLGIDIYSNQTERFSFDVEITARYRSKSLQYEEVPSRQLENVVDDLARSVRFLNPRLSGASDKSQRSGGPSLLGSID
jgi:hypothetical protein